MAGAQDAIASFWGIFMCRWTRIVYTMLESKQSGCIMFVQKPLDQFCDLHVGDTIMAAQLAGVTTVAHMHLE